MPYTIINHGVWRKYTPDPMPAWAVEVAAMGAPVAFLQRESDGVDWYAFRNADGSFTEGSVLATTLLNPTTGVETVGSTFRDESMIFPVDQRLIEVLGVPEGEDKPHNLLAWLTYHPDTNTFSGEPVAPQPPVIELSVSAAQALIQLSRMPHDGSVVPGADNLLDATEELVAASKDRELKTWFARAQRWIITNPNVQKIGAAFKLSAEEIRAAFEAAALIEE